MLKTCFRCKVPKELSKFYKRYKGAPDGHEGTCKECRNPDIAANKRHKYNTDPEYKAKRLAAGSAKGKALRRRYREQFIELYGGCCACCGEIRYEFLSLDHVNGGGAQERREIQGRDIYKKALSIGTPLPEYRCLCHNCNQSYGFYGYCPHTKELNPA